MTALQQLIKQLNSLAATQESNSIHVASMLDITKRIYAELITLNDQETPSVHNENNTPQTAFVEPQIAPTYNAAMPSLMDNGAPAEDVDLNDEMEAFFNNSITPNDHLHEAKNEVIPDVEMPKHQAMSGINFEFPPQQIVTKVHVVVTPPSPTEEEAPVIPSLVHDTYGAIKEDSIAEEKQVAEENDVTNAGRGFKSPVVPNQKDFRSQIGFNDRYLFLNELFHNDKEMYETFISKINNTNNHEDAKQWISDEVAQHLNWAKDDVTVQSFYALVDKYFTTT